MFCHVIQLRKGGNWLPRSQVAGSAGARGWLDFRKANPAYYGLTWDARLLSLKTLDKDCLEPLHYARILAIKDGGIMLTGMEITFRAVKSKPTHTQQTWWCVVHEEEGYAALERHNPKSSSGFDVNDDDMTD
ncbi:hypothetical protein ABL840_09290 [Variovorax sp. NFACC27]|uniref:hypothetical protein n=1 Tax=unclassified Variovorax TaxID=663243 RepID=UPI000896E0A4|nr:hypothetical protein SAMN03159371_05240 [Variovorax sp. NFACC28]SEG89773.1 hypothetical protein SAMN03159365_05207 [Variovorax sp. NFACC29]SFD39647.1 hypothetical protein SAMN03159379_05130 [Variovorax sp. NFACC26]SFG42060.1 hypothetical protein SAMN03159447_03240 [Variovorax sp. NFACC27]